MRLLAYASLLVLVSPLGCSGPSQTLAASALPLPALSVSTAAIYAEIAATPPQELLAGLELARSLTPRAYYQALLAHTDDVDLTIDGIHVGSALAQLKAQAATYATLDHAYPSMGAFWDQIGYSGLSFDYAHFAAEVHSSLDASGLALTTYPAYCQYGTEGVTCDNGVTTYEDKQCSGFWNGLERNGIGQLGVARAFAKAVQPESDGSATESSSSFHSFTATVKSSGLSRGGVPSQTWYLNSQQLGNIDSGMLNHCTSGPDKKRGFAPPSSSSTVSTLAKMLTAAFGSNITHDDGF